MNVCGELVITLYSCPFCGAEYMSVMHEMEKESILEFEIFSQGDYDESIETHNREFQCKLCREYLRVPE